MIIPKGIEQIFFDLLKVSIAGWYNWKYNLSEEPFMSAGVSRENIFGYECQINILLIFGQRMFCTKEKKDVLDMVSLTDDSWWVPKEIRMKILNELKKIL